MYYYGNLGSGMWIFGMAWMIIFWVGVIWFIVWLVRKTSQSGNESSHSQETPLEILGKRYAKGDISRKKYSEMRKELKAK